MWGILARILGACFVLLRRPISDAGRRWREWQGVRVGPNTQSPAVIAVGGAVFLVAGPLVIIGVLTGFLPTR